MSIMRRRVTRRGAVRQPTGGRRRMGRGPVRSRPTRTGDGPKRPMPTAITRRRRPTRTGDGPKRPMPTAITRRRRPTQRMTAQQRAGLAARRRRPSTGRATAQRGALAAQRRAARRGTSLRRAVSPARLTGGRGSRRINQANQRMSRARRR